METSHSEEMINKVSACIEFDNIEIKKKSMKTVTAPISLDKIMSDN